MTAEYEILESNIPFSESIIWKMNRTYYENAGLSAWSDGVVPHNMTSNAYVGKTYAALILAYLKDIAASHLPDETIYIVELGAGHGRLAFHILQHLDDLVLLEHLPLPKYCYVLTDIVTGNLNFFESHPQLLPFFESGKLDVAYYDGISSTELVLRKSQMIISQGQLQSPIIAIANYFFDSLPNDLYAIQDGKYYPCNLTVESYLDMDVESPTAMLKFLKTTVQVDFNGDKKENDPFIVQLMDEYAAVMNKSFILLPRFGIQCLENLQNYSTSGMMLLTIDKGYADLKDLIDRPEPEIIRHGSMSLYVNFHALGKFCDAKNGTTLFAPSADSSLQLACLLFSNKPTSYPETYKVYDQYVKGFGPDDYNGMKKMVYRLVRELTFKELIITLKMGYYDSNLFVQLLPFIRKRIESLSLEDSHMLAPALHKIEKYFFNIKESVNTSYEIAGLFYDVGFYNEALHIYEKLSKNFGPKADIYYNVILCYYQLRMDKIFITTLQEAKLAFPDFEKFDHLDTLDLKAI